MAPNSANEIEKDDENELAAKLDELRSPRRAMVTFDQMRIAIAATRNHVGVSDDQTEEQYRERAKRTLETVFAMTSRDAAIVAPCVEIRHNENFKLPYTPKETMEANKKMNGENENANGAATARRIPASAFKSIAEMNDKTDGLNKNAVRDVAAGRRRADRVFGSIAAMN